MDISQPCFGSVPLGCEALGGPRSNPSKFDYGNNGYADEMQQNDTATTTSTTTTDYYSSTKAQPCGRRKRARGGNLQRRQERKRLRKLRRRTVQTLAKADPSEYCAVLPELT